MDNSFDGFSSAFSMFLLVNLELLADCQNTDSIVANFGEILHFATIESFTVKTVSLTAEKALMLISAILPAIHTTLKEQSCEKLQNVQQIVAQHPAFQDFRGACLDV